MVQVKAAHFSRTSSLTAARLAIAVSTYMCGFAAMAYFAMLSGQGWTAIAGCRQFFYARYADWAVTVSTPPGLVLRV
jgi:bacteriorhodopsin